MHSPAPRPLYRRSARRRETRIRRIARSEAAAAGMLVAPSKHDSKGPQLLLRNAGRPRARDGRPVLELLFYFID
jgi:hypothetical protein